MTSRNADSQPTTSPATAFAATLLTECAVQGVQHIVVCPGSRSQALALAAAELEARGIVNIHVRIDERVAGFLALGLAVESGAPVVVITTSGTAVANLHPAALEAHHQGVPLVLLTGDRPEELRGVGANQTTTQPGIFAAAVQSWDIPAPEGSEGEGEEARRLAAKAVATARGDGGASPRPVHINLALREPLSSADCGDIIAEVQGQPPLIPRSIPLTHLRIPADLEPADGTVVIAGSGAGARAEQVARDLGAPLLAEVASGARFGPNLVVHYRELLEDAEAFPVSRAIVFGRPTLSRQVLSLLARDGVESIGVRGAGAEDFNPLRKMSRIVDEVRVPNPVADRDPQARARVGRWVAASRGFETVEDAAPDASAADADYLRGELLAIRAPVTRQALTAAVWRATWPHDRLVLGASRLIRDLDGTATGKRVSVHANRGLAGIDGTIATAVGIAIASQRAGSTGTTRVLLGDLAALHDAGALALPADEGHPRIQVVVGDDGGGTIFDLLEIGGHRDAAFERVMTTPQPVDFEALAGAYGWLYVRVESRGALDQALTAAQRPTLVHVPIPR